MNYVYYRDKRGNFGDDLNGYLWPKLFKNSIKEDLWFIGIGSVLHAESRVIKTIGEGKKIVFGTGIRPSKFYNKFEFLGVDWDVLFLRGPLSARETGNQYDYITDGAYALRQLDDFAKFSKIPKKYKVSVMPYFHSVDYFDWQKICDDLGYNYISPFAELGIEHTLSEIAASELVISEAMHGAILSDILRVPWHRLILSTPHTEGERVSDFKWNDWLASIRVDNTEPTFVPFYRTVPKLGKLVKSLSNNYLSFQYLPKNQIKRELKTKMSDLNKISFYLSSNDRLIEIDDQINLKIQQFKSTYGVE